MTSTRSLSGAPPRAALGATEPAADDGASGPCPKSGKFTADQMGMPVPSVGPRRLLKSSAPKRAKPVATTPSGVRVAEIFKGPETFNLDGTLKLWSRVERLELAEPRRQTPFNEGLAWPQDADSAPFIPNMFGTSTPAMDTCLLHYAPDFEKGKGKPLLIVHGAGDNASRVSQRMAQQLAERGIPAAAITLPHPHGDPRENADLIAAAIERIKQETGQESVDVVTHSAGFHSVAVYNANHEAGIDWGWEHPPQTVYRGDIDNIIAISGPLDGIDATHRYPALSLLALDQDKAINGSAWSQAGAQRLDRVDLPRDLIDYFPLQAAISKPQPVALPVAQPRLAPIAAFNPNPLTTYFGGLGWGTFSKGIDRAVSDAGNFVDRLQAIGLSPGTTLHALSGGRPVLVNGAGAAAREDFGDEIVDFWTRPINATAALTAPWLKLNPFYTGALAAMGIEPSLSTIRGLIGGNFLPGELSADSDGVVFTGSQQSVDPYLHRGAERGEVIHFPGLSHTDTPVASPKSADELEAAVNQDPVRFGHLRETLETYRDQDAIGTVHALLRG